MKTTLKITKSALIAASLAFAIPMSSAPAFASGGGGGGGGGSGGFSGSSAPQYDPVEEYKSGVEALNAKDYKKASKAFKRVLKVARKDANSNQYLAQSYAGMGKHKDAGSYYLKAIRYDETRIGLYAKAAEAYTAAGKGDKANKVLSDLDKRIAKCGECADKTSLGSARSDVEAAIAGTTDTEAFLLPKTQLAAGEQYFNAVGLINQARYDEAITELKTMALYIGPHPDVMNYLGYSHRKLGMFARAESYYLTALAVDPNHRGANEYLGELYIEMGQMDKARAQLAKLQNICSFGCIEETELSGWITNAAP